MDSNLLYYLYHLATQFGGEVHADSNEVVLCFPNSSPPKRQEDESWPIEASASPLAQMTTPEPPKPNRHRVLSDMDQFLKEQQLNQDTLERQQTMKRQAELRTGDLPYRNYPDGRPPRP